MIDRKLMTCKILSSIKPHIQKDVNKVFHLRDMLEDIPDDYIKSQLRKISAKPVYKNKLKQALATDAPVSYIKYFDYCDTRPVLPASTLGYTCKLDILDILIPMISDISHPDPVVWEYTYRYMNNLIKHIRSEI